MARVTRQNIDKEFDRQKVPAASLPPEAERDALARLATGILKASLGAPGIPQEKVREQVIANVVAAYVYPQDPRDVHASMMPRLVQANFDVRQPKKGPIDPTLKPSKDVVRALAEAAIGFLHEGRSPWPAMGKLLVVQSVVSYYLAGA
jgi:hypothetical protein